MGIFDKLTNFFHTSSEKSVISTEESQLFEVSFASVETIIASLHQEVIRVVSDSSRASTFGKISENIVRIRKIEESIRDCRKVFRDYAKKDYSDLYQENYSSWYSRSGMANRLYFAQVLKNLTKTVLEKIEHEQGGDAFLLIENQKCSVSECLQIIQETKEGIFFYDLYDLIRVSRSSSEWKKLPRVHEVKPYLPDGSLIDGAVIALRADTTNILTDMSKEDRKKLIEELSKPTPREDRTEFEQPSQRNFTR